MALDDELILLFDNDQKLYNLRKQWITQAQGDWTKLADTFKAWLEREGERNANRLDELWSSLLLNSVYEVDTDAIGRHWFEQWEESEAYNKQAAAEANPDMGDEDETLKSRKRVIRYAKPTRRK